jgi:hypothetical protein
MSFTFTFTSQSDTTILARLLEYNTINSQCNKKHDVWGNILPFHHLQVVGPWRVPIVLLDRIKYLHGAQSTILDNSRIDLLLVHMVRIDLLLVHMVRIDTMMDVYVFVFAISS